MIKNFKKNIVLTSQNPEAWLVFSYDGSSRVIDPSIDPSLEDIYINGWSPQTINNASGAGITLDSTTKIAPFHVYTTSKEDFDVSLGFIIDDSIPIIEYVNIFNRPFLLNSDEFNTFDTFNPLVDNEASYLLLRTNPKFSGNIKLVVDPSYNMFLDTFKVSDILSSKKYRKQNVSGNSFLSGDIRRVFSTLPSGEIFRLSDEDTLNLQHPKTTFGEQFDTTYDYGAKMLIDELYSEEYSMLAPLWVNSVIPDHFVIFRMDGTYNEETYDEVSLAGLAESYITNGQLIKSWNLKENSPLGKYLDNHLNELLNVESPVNLSLNEYDPNTWNGMAVDKGIITGRSEVPYFFEQITNNFTETNAFVSRGFERQNLLCPNLVNMEFIFNDSDVSSYTMNRYFGLYMSENELYKFAYYSDISTGVDFRIISLDGRDVSIFIDSSIFDVNGNVDGIYENRIFVRNDGVELERICCTSQIDGSRNQIDNYVNKLGRNIFSTKVENKSINPYVTLKINTLLAQGEHLRVVNLTQGKIWEVYGVETELFNPGDSGPYVSYNEPSVGYPDLYRSAFSIKGSISDQANAISNAFKLFKNYEYAPFSVGVTKSNGLSLIIDDENDNDHYVFQRLTGQIAYAIGDPSSTFNSAAAPEDITYFSVFTPDSSNFERLTADASYGPIDFELYGDRFSIMVDFMNVDDYYVYSFDASTTEFFTDNVLYIGNDKWNRLIQDFDVSAGSIHSYQYTDDPTSTENNAVVITENKILLDQTNKWYGYNVYPIYVSLLGVNPVKYFDYTVYDSSLGFESNYRTARENDEETYKLEIPFGSTKTITSRNSYVITEGMGFVDIDSSSIEYNITSDEFPFNTFFGPATIRATANTTIKYDTLDGSFNYTSYDSSISEENIEDYYQYDFLLDASGLPYTNRIELKYGLVIPTISKWGTNGRDSRGNPVRLMLTPYLFDDPSTVNSNFIPVPDSSLYSNELSYPVFKYLSPGGDSWKDYIYYDINDVLDVNGERKSIRDLMFNEPYTDVFSKMIYNNNQVSGDATRSSILYYNLYENKIITILGGAKLGIEVTPVGEKLFNVTNWNRYRFSLISSPTRNLAHNNPIEVIINQNTETVLMIWYQGADVLHYNKRYSEITPGKNNLIDYNNKGGKEYMGFVTGDPSYSYVKSPFIMNTNSIGRQTENIFEKSTISSYDSSIVSPWAQFSHNIKNSLSSIFNAYETSTGNNEVVANQFNFLLSLDSFDQTEIDYTYSPAALSYGNNVSNIAYNYINNYNYYHDKTGNIDIFKDIIDNNNIKYYIIEEDEVYPSEIFQSAPVSVTLYDPILYQSPGYDTSIYTYNGSYRPIFKNVLNFEDNENINLINILEKDFVFGNTNLQSYNSIDQYWVNRVVENVTSADSSNNILYIKDFNPFKSLWDDDYFILSEGSVQTLIDGYVSDLEHSTMFGSKLISLPEKITLDNWNAANTKVVTKTDYFSLEYNLTKTIIDLFTNDNTFIKNWDGLPNVTSDVINKYIIKTVLRNYNISIDKIQTKVFYKLYDGEILKRTYDSSFDREYKNFNSELAIINNEYIYKIQIPTDNFNSYFTRFTFTKK